MVVWREACGPTNQVLAAILFRILIQGSRIQIWVMQTDRCCMSFFAFARWQQQILDWVLCSPVLIFRQFCCCCISVSFEFTASTRCRTVIRQATSRYYQRREINPSISASLLYVISILFPWESQAWDTGNHVQELVGFYWVNLPEIHLKLNLVSVMFYFG